MRRAALLIAFFAASASAQQLVVNPSHATIVPGQSITVAVANHAGFSTPLPVTANFFTAGPIVIDRIDTGIYGSKILTVRALAVGDAAISAESPNGGYSYGIIATFNVVECDNAQPHVTITVYTSLEYRNVTLMANGSPEGGTYEWFAGSPGDTSVPWPSNLPNTIWFDLPSFRNVEYWVRYTTPCGVATAFVSIGPPRKRTVRH
jgi:hypothetical protein